MRTTITLSNEAQQQRRSTMTTKESSKAQYRAQLEEYIYMTKAAAIRLDNNFWREVLTIRERIDIYISVFG